MADNRLTVVRADANVETLRSKDIGSLVQAQVVVTPEHCKTVPTLTGATIGLISVTSGAAVTLDPPDAGALSCFVRVWETAQQVDVRVFYRRDGTAPTNAGANCEGFLRHEEGIIVTGTLTNFKVIAESGGSFQMTCEYSNL